MTKQTIKSIQSAIARALIFAMVWNLFALPLAASSSKDRRSSKPSSKSKAPAKSLQGGGGFVIWGPQQVVRQPINTTYYANFPLPAGAIPPYTMTVSNGAPDGTRKVTQACVKLNGANVLSPTCYHSVNPTPQTRTVSLLADNAVQVQLIGPVLSYITITVTGSQASFTVNPTSGNQGQTVSVGLTGTGTNWAQGQTVASFGGEITVNSLTINSTTSATAQIAISQTAALAPRTVTMTTGVEVVSAVDAFTVNAATPPGFASSTVSTLAGAAGSPGFTNGTGGAARFRNPAGLAAAASDVVYVADAGNHAIRRVDSAGVVTTVAGNGNPGFLDGQGANAQFNNPQGVAIDASGNLYVADSGNHGIRRIDAAGNVTTIAGDGTAGFVNGSGAAARFNNPRGIAVDAANKIFVADTGNHAVRRIDAGNAVTTLAGDGTPGATDSPGARFNGLAGIVVEGAQVYVYLADTGNHRLRRLDGTNTVITLAGLDRGFKDGTAAQSRFADPAAVALDGSGHVVVADTTNSLVRDVDPVKALNNDPLAVITLAGTGARGLVNGAGNVAQFNKPSGVAVAPSSAVLVADTANQVLRRILLPPVIAAISPPSGNAGAPVTISGSRFDERGPSFNTVRFAASGGGTVTANVTSATRTQLNVTVPAGAVTGAVTVQTAGGTSNGVAFTVGSTQPPAIADFNPKTGPVGTLVTITGTNLKIGATDPAVTFAGAGGTRLPALVAFSSATEVRATAPNATVTGVIQLTTSAGTATTALPFTVAPSQDYTIALAPSSASVVQGSTATFVVSVTSPQTTFTQLVKLTAAGLPSGAMASFSPDQITAGATSTLTVRTANALSPSSYSFTVNGVTKVDGSDLNRGANGSISVIAAGQTTLAGRVLSTGSEPIMGATVSLDGQTATTNAAGSFILSGISAGMQRAVMVDGRTASAPNATYPVIVEPADIVAGQSNVVPYTFYLPAIDTQYEVTVVPTVATAIGNPRVTNLTMTIPANANLRNRDGSLVTRASITPVAIDRTPAPLPSNLGTTLVYTSQPGGACIMNAQNQCTTTGAKIPVVYPNLAGASPGTSVPLWSFNHDTAVWYQYGTGTVSADGKTIAPDAGVGLSDFSWHFPAINPDGPGPDDSCPTSQGPKRVDYSTGLKIETMTDISFGGARGGLSVSRTYTTDLANPVNGVSPVYRFGVGFRDNYDVRLTGTFQANGAGRVVWPEQLNGRLFSHDALLSGGGVPTFTSRRTTGQLGDTVRRINASTLEYRSTAGFIMRFEPHPNGQYYRLKSIIDRNGNTATLSYDGSNNLTSVTDAVGRSITFAYNAPNCAECIRTATDPMGRVTTYGYDGSKRLTQVTDALGKTMSYAYVGANQLASVTDRRGNVVKQIGYDANRRVVSQTFADGGTEQYVYTLSGTVVTGVTIIDSVGRTMTKRFNSAGYVIEETDGLGQPSKIERTIGTNLATKTTGPCGYLEAEKTYNTFGQVTSIKDRLNKTESWQYRTLSAPSDYDPLLDQVVQYTDKRGNVTSYGYDTIAPNTLTPRGNMTTMTDARSKVTTYTYDYARGAVMTRVTDPLNNKRDYDYDANGFMNSDVVRRNSDQAVISQTTYEFDAVGNTKKVTDGEGRVTTMNYDALNRMINSTDPANAVTTYGYDENGNNTSVTDALSRQWTSSYDKKERLETATDPLGRVSRWQYDAADQLLKIISPSGRVLRNTYDERGQRITVTDGLGNVATFVYDNRGNLKALNDQRGNTTTFEYDELFRLTGQRDPLGRLTKLEYDDANNVKAKVDRLGRRTDIVYDVLNRPQQVTYADATVNYGYDDSRRWTSISDAAGTIAWSYDEANRVRTETTSLGVMQYDYNKASQRKTMVAADRAPVAYGFDTAGRLQTITQGSETFTYGYDTISRRISLARPNGVTTSYEYDQLDRLKRLRHVNASSVALEDLQYEFNLDGEINKITSLASAPLTPQSKTVSAADAANRVGQFGAASFGFDAEGQTANRTDASGTGTFQWDARGRLTQVTLPNGQLVNYGYDALGRRISRVTGGSATTFQYDALDVVIDRVSSGGAFDYLNGLGIDDKLRQAGGASGTLYFLQDHLGSTAALTSPGGGLVEQRQHEAFGASAGSVQTRYGYTGREQDELTGLNYYRARWFDPSQGRFLREDPIGFQSGLNLYRYVSNNPVSRNDPLGLIDNDCLKNWALSGTLAVGALGAGAGAALGGGLGALAGGFGAIPLGLGGAIKGGAFGAGAGALAGGLIGSLVCGDSNASDTGSGTVIPFPPRPSPAPTPAPSDTAREPGKVIPLPKPKPKPCPLPPPPPPPKNRAGVCMAALMECAGWASGDMNKLDLCSRSHAECVGTNLPVIFPNGRWVPPLP
jgi:RHS repeat-associated protein